MRILHTMLRVKDLKKSIDFYTLVLQMKVLFKQDFPQGRFTLAFLGYDMADSQVAIELTHNWDTESYELGSAFGHIAIAVGDVYQVCEKMRELGAEIVREAGPMGNGPVLAFVKDPDGYMIELLEKDPLSFVEEK